MYHKKLGDGFTSELRHAESWTSRGHSRRQFIEASEYNEIPQLRKEQLGLQL
jgi:hypothetical protein